MKKRTKVLLLLLSAVLLVAASVFGTMAYLTSKDDVKNTFTVGKVGIELKETKVTEYGVGTGTTTDSNAYKLIPGHEYTKDPKIYIAEDSESCWLFVKVENGISALETEDTTKTIAAQIAQNGWTALSGVEGVYYKFWNKDAQGVEYTQKVFEKFTIKPTAQSDASWKDGLEVNVTAYAIQEDGFDGASEAWAALDAQIGNN